MLSLGNGFHSFRKEDTVVRIGLLGASGIAPAAVIRPARRRSDASVVAVAARSGQSAATYAEKHDIERSYGSYRELLADPDIDLIYNALPPSEHAEWSIAALQSGKDVLCEKPFAMNSAQVLRMNQAANDTGHRLIEAFHDRYHPLSLELDAVKASGRLGEIQSLHGDFVYNNPFDALSIRHDPALGGGALMDLGCYPLHWLRAFMNEEPTVTEAVATLNPMGADMSMDATLQFSGGATGRVTASMHADAVAGSTLRVVGTSGTLLVENLVFPSAGHTIVETVGGVDRARTVAGATTYDHQLEAVISALASGMPLPTEGADPIGNMAAIDAIYEAAGIRRSYE
jgi:predicted dehydrogenase